MESDFGGVELVAHTITTNDLGGFFFFFFWFLFVLYLCESTLKLLY